ncbi:MAG TPA: DUF423 domain-containing protein [Methylomirabilota bacterium]|nr:DUF423 domain-containing protein [Methylomirabilota bacterium]
MDRLFLAIGCVSAVVAVVLGAFGAHGLRARLVPDMLSTFEIGVRYQMYHALALLAVGILLPRSPSPALAVAGWLFVAGTVVFSGSLYVLAVTGQRWLGAVTPLGGAAFIAGWLVLAWAVSTRP